MLKSYKEMAALETHKERMDYLYLGDKLCEETFGSQRYLNQRFYTSKEWRRFRDIIIARDEGCDLAVEGCGLGTRNILIHHINPITIDDIIHQTDALFDEDNVVCVSKRTHNYIHYGTENKELTYVERTPNDTCPWKK